MWTSWLWKPTLSLHPHAIRLCSLHSPDARNLHTYTEKSKQKSSQSSLYSINHVINRYSVQVHPLTASFGWTYLTGIVFLKRHLYTDRHTSFPTHPHLSSSASLCWSCRPLSLPAWTETGDLSQVSLTLSVMWSCLFKWIFAYLIAPYKYFLLLQIKQK